MSSTDGNYRYVKCVHCLKPLIIPPQTAEHIRNKPEPKHSKDTFENVVDNLDDIRRTLMFLLHEGGAPAHFQRSITDMLEDRYDKLLRGLSYDLGGGNKDS